MDHSITGLIDCPSARHAAADTRRPTYESADERDGRGSGALRAAGQAAAAGRGEATERRWIAQNTQRHVDHLARSPDRPPHSVGSRASTLRRRGAARSGTNMLVLPDRAQIHPGKFGKFGKFGRFKKSGGGLGKPCRQIGHNQQQSSSSPPEEDVPAGSDNELEALLERELAEQREQEATDARQPAGGQREVVDGHHREATIRCRMVTSREKRSRTL